MCKGFDRHGLPLFRFTVGGEEFTLVNPDAMKIDDGDLAGGLRRMLGDEQFERFERQKVLDRQLRRLIDAITAYYDAITAHYEGMNRG